MRPPHRPERFHRANATWTASSLPTGCAARQTQPRGLPAAKACPPCRAKRLQPVWPWCVLQPVVAALRFGAGPALARCCAGVLAGHRSRSDKPGSAPSTAKATSAKPDSAQRAQGSAGAKKRAQPQALRLRRRPRPAAKVLVLVLVLRWAPERALPRAPNQACRRIAIGARSHQARQVLKLAHGLDHGHGLRFDQLHLPKAGGPGGLGDAQVRHQGTCAGPVGLRLQLNQVPNGF